MVPEEALVIRPDGSLGVVVLSDSVGMVSGYPHALFKELGRLLAPRKVVGVDASVTGYTSFQGVRYFERDIAPLRPDVVVINYGWNDHWAAHNGKADRDQRPPSASSTGLAGSSRLLGVLAQGMMRVRRSSYQATGGEGEVLRVSLKDYRANLRRLVQGVRAEGGMPVLVTAPYLKPADDDERWLVLHRRYNEATRALAREAKVPLLDMVQDLLTRAEAFMGPPDDRDFVHITKQAGVEVAKKLAGVIHRALAARR